MMEDEVNGVNVDVNEVVSTDVGGEADAATIALAAEAAASVEPQFCKICGKGEDGRTMCRFFPIEHDDTLDITTVQPSTFTEDVTLHVFCGKTASILPQVNLPQYEILSKAGIKNKHGIGPEVNGALARTRYAIAPGDDSTERPEKAFYLVKEFEAHLAAIRSVSAQRTASSSNEYLNDPIAAAHAAAAVAAGITSPPNPSISGGVGMGGGGGGGGPPTSSSQQQQQHQQQHQQPQQHQHVQQHQQPQQHQHVQQHQPHLAPPPQQHQQHQHQQYQVQHQQQPQQHQQYQHQHQHQQQHPKPSPVKAAAGQNYKKPTLRRPEQDFFGFVESDVAGIGHSPHMHGQQQQQPEDHNLHPHETTTPDGKVRCGCGGTHWPTGTDKGDASWKSHIMTKKHQKWVQENFGGSVN